MDFFEVLEVGVDEFLERLQVQCNLLLTPSTTAATSLQYYTIPGGQYPFLFLSPRTSTRGTKNFVHPPDLILFFFTFFVYQVYITTVQDLLVDQDRRSIFTQTILVCQSHLPIS